MWRVTIDQIAESGETQRYEHNCLEPFLSDAIEEALEAHRLLRCQQGQYQITSVYTTDRTQRYDLL